MSACDAVSACASPRVALCPRPAFLLYLVPAVLYCVYNMLTFVNLSAFDPTTYFLLLQLRVVVTGVMYQVSDVLSWVRAE